MYSIAREDAARDHAALRAAADACGNSTTAKRVTEIADAVQEHLPEQKVALSRADLVFLAGGVVPEWLRFDADAALGDQ